jgi:ATP-binding cassette subfamily C protein LapB
MFEIFNRLKSNQAFLVRILIASLFVNLLALATPIYVIQVLQRYVAYGVTSTLVTLVVGVIVISIFEFFFKNIRHRMARELEPINTDLANQVMAKLSNLKTSFYAFNQKFRSDIITSHVKHKVFEGGFIKKCTSKCTCNAVF